MWYGLQCEIIQKWWYERPTLLIVQHIHKILLGLFPGSTWKSKTQYLSLRSHTPHSPSLLTPEDVHLQLHHTSLFLICITHLYFIVKVENQIHTYTQTVRAQMGEEIKHSIFCLYISPSSLRYQACGKSVRPVWRHNNKKHKPHVSQNIYLFQTLLFLFSS